MKIFLSKALSSVPNAMDNSAAPLSLLILASVVEEAGHGPKIIFPFELDMFLEQNINSLGRCDAFGFTVNSFNWYKTKKAIDIIHHFYPGLKIILGGPHATALHEHCLKSSSANIVVRNEGEKTLPDLLCNLAVKKNLESVEGITYKDHRGEIIVNRSRHALTEEEMNSMPLPAYELIPPNRYEYISVETSRGCPFQCIFCCIPYERGFRKYSLERVDRLFKTISQLRDRFTRGTIFFSDDSFATDKAHVTGVLDSLQRIDPSLSIGCEVRITDMLRHDLFRIFEGINVYLMQVGVECGYEEGLKLTGKKLGLDKIFDFANKCSVVRFRYNLYWSFVIGFPWEKEDHIIKTINFGYNLAARTGSQPPQINNFLTYPGSIITDNYAKYGIKKTEASYYDSPDWYQSFLASSLVSPPNRQFIAEYLRHIHYQFSTGRMEYPSLLNFPDGKVLNNLNF